MEHADRRLVVASGNPGKLREFRRLLERLPYTLVSQAELGVSPPAETGTSFVENALIKARHAGAAAGSAALADDSGLEVDALGGSPGIFSARFAGDGADDAMNNAKRRSPACPPSTAAPGTGARWCSFARPAIRRRSLPRASGKAGS